MPTNQANGIDFGDRTQLNLLTFTVLVTFHIGAVAALFYFTWTNLFVTAVIYWMAVSWGIGLGYHRLHTHRGYRVPQVVGILPGSLRHVGP